MRSWILIFVILLCGCTGPKLVGPKGTVKPPPVSFYGPIRAYPTYSVEPGKTQFFYNGEPVTAEELRQRIKQKKADMLPPGVYHWDEKTQTWESIKQEKPVEQDKVA